MDGGTVRSMIPGVLAATSQAYRDGMAHVAGHVHVVTTAGAAGTSGFTAIAVASVSDDPPMLLVCLNRKSANGDLIGRNGVFAVNALPSGAEGLAETFAGRRGLAGAERFREGSWTPLVTGSPTLDTALVSFDCRVEEMRPMATHHILIGRVEAVRIGPAGAALAYFDRAYRPIPR
ncbi:flavin reductase family protein [Phreatobacter sp.]|uniref:flavin reductase family protein n=1 Tax=Phreatobacter sp. TaxID=1966341 RepID=UPI0022C98682|nr:flavin reductase family protein [Phreatobacter sp.]MCZ8314447.1 flavin reductase family protein [Phreatobacter sp.]